MNLDAALKNLKNYDTHKFSCKRDRPTQDQYHVAILDNHSNEMIFYIDQTSQNSFIESYAVFHHVTKILNDDYILYCWEMECWLEIGLLF